MIEEIIEDKSKKDGANIVNGQNTLNSGLDSLPLLLHQLDNPGKAGLGCPYIFWEGYDLNHCPGVGEWKCRRQKFEYVADEFGTKSVDCRECTRSNYVLCEVYKDTNKTTIS